MAQSSKLLIIIGGIVAIVGQFWGGPGMIPNWYLPLIGGAVAIIGGLLLKK